MARPKVGHDYRLVIKNDLFDEPIAWVNYAPYGRPRKEFLVMLGAGFVIAGLIGARLAWAVCRKI